MPTSTRIPLRVLFARPHRRVFRLPRRSVQYAPVSRFIDLKYTLAETKLLGKSKKGQQPLLGRFKGDCKGGAPARTQRSGSCGKRRNNETDETCRLRQGEGCEVCSDANSPFAILSFDRQRRFLSHAEKESGVETFPRAFGANKVSPLRGDENRVLRARPLCLRHR